MIRIKTAIVIFITALVCVRPGFAQEAEKFLVVARPVADIRAEPKDGAAGYGHDDLDETQVLYNEILRYRGEKTDWYRVEALEQREFSHHDQWQGYPGWIRKDNVRFIEKRPEYTLVVNCPAANIVNAPENNPEIITPVLAGTKFENIGGKNDFYKVRLPDGGIGWVSKQAVTRIQPLINNARSRERIVTAAKLFLGVPYVWGGRSMQVSFMPEIATGVDCSGLVNLAYRLNGGDIARDAHEQWMTARPIAAEELQPADLIFLSKPDKHDVITHVMLSLGGEDFIEAPGTGTTVRICDFKTKFGLGRRGLQAKQYMVNARKLYFGRIIP